MPLSPRARRRLATGAAVSALAMAVPGVAVAATVGSPGSPPAGATTGTAGPDVRPSAGPGTLATALKACTPTTFSAAQQALRVALQDRTAAIGRLQTTVARAKDLPAADAAELDAILHAELSTIDGAGLDGLVASVAADTTCAQLVTAAKAMVTDFRLYALVAPQVRVTVAVGRGSALAARVTAAEPRIAARIARDARAGKDVAGALQAFADLKVETAAAAADLQRVSVPELLAQVPSGYPADRPVVESDLAAVRAAAQAGRTVRDDLQTIRHELA